MRRSGRVRRDKHFWDEAANVGGVGGRGGGERHGE